MNQNHDQRGRFASVGSAAAAQSAARRAGRYPVIPHASVKSVGSHTSSDSPGFTTNTLTQRQPTHGVSVAGATTGHHIGGGSGWDIERVNIAREETLGKSLGRQRNQQAVYNLKTHQTIDTHGTGDYTPRKYKRPNLAGIK